MSEAFDENIEKRRSISEKYRLAVIDEENLKEVRSFRVSLLNIYILLSSILVVLGILIISLIFFTPVKRLVPGYGDMYENKEFKKLTEKVSELEKAIEVQDLYNQGLKKMILGEKGEEIDLPSGTFSGNGNEATSKDKAAYISPEEIGEKKSTKLLGSLFFVSPLKGSISAKFLDPESHLGVDILAPKDTPIKSVMPGIVIFSDWTMESGNTLAIQHENNIVSIYKHNSTLFKKIGDRVHSGEAIAVIGNTGKLTDGPHLHFELWYDGYAVDPEKYISFN